MLTIQNKSQFDSIPTLFDMWIAGVARGIVIQAAFVPKPISVRVCELVDLSQSHFLLAVKNEGRLVFAEIDRWQFATVVSAIEAHSAQTAEDFLKVIREVAADALAHQPQGAREKGGGFIF